MTISFARFIWKIGTDQFRIWISRTPLPTGWTDKWYIDGDKVYEANK